MSPPPGDPMRGAVRHGLIVYAGTAVSSLIMLGAKVYINRGLGTEVLGQYELGLSLVLLISVFALSGLHTSMARTIAKEGRKAYPLMRKAFLWVLALCALALLVANPLVNAFYGDKVGQNFALYISFLLFALCLLNLNMAFYQGRQKMGHVSGIMATDAVVRGIAVAAAVMFVFRARSLLLLIGFFALSFELVVTSRIFSRVSKVSDGAMHFRQLAHLSFYIFLIAASGAISTRVSAFVIAYKLDALNLGWFAIATLLTLPVSLLGKTIETVLLPRASADAEFQLQRFALVAVGLAVVLPFAYYVVGPPIVHILFGTGMTKAIEALRILAIGYSAILVYSVFSAFIFGRAPHSFLGKLVTVTFLQSLVVAPALNAYLVGRMGLSGAAWATNTSLLIQTGLWVTAGAILERKERKQARMISS